MQPHRHGPVTRVYSTSPRLPSPLLVERHASDHQRGREKPLASFTEAQSGNFPSCGKWRDNLRFLLGINTKPISSTHFKCIYGPETERRGPQSGETNSKCGYKKEFISFLSTFVITAIMPVSQVGGAGSEWEGRRLNPQILPLTQAKTSLSNLLHCGLKSFSHTSLPPPIKAESLESPPWVSTTLREGKKKGIYHSPHPFSSWRSQRGRSDLHSCQTLG